VVLLTIGKIEHEHKLVKAVTAVTASFPDDHVGALDSIRRTTM
jgi:hypothetical protein